MGGDWEGQVSMSVMFVNGVMVLLLFDLMCDAQ